MKRKAMIVGLIAAAALLLLAGIFQVRVAIARRQLATAIAGTPATQPLDSGHTETLSILPLYEEAGDAATYNVGHGVAYLIRTDEITILMDLGNNPDQAFPAPLVANMARAGIGAEDIDLLFISHPHPDHMGGLWWRPAAFDDEGASVLDADTVLVPTEGLFPGAATTILREPRTLAPGVVTLGLMPYDEVFPFSIKNPIAYEQVLAVNVKGAGVVLITGCGHPTLERIVEHAEEVLDQSVVGVVGGLHYEEQTASEVRPHVEFLADRGPQLVALSPHDVGPVARDAFAAAFPDAYRAIRVGQTIRLGPGSP